MMRQPFKAALVLILFLSVANSSVLISVARIHAIKFVARHRLFIAIGARFDVDKATELADKTAIKLLLLTGGDYSELQTLQECRGTADRCVRAYGD
jgi:hypothetical protein